MSWSCKKYLALRAVLIALAFLVAPATADAQSTGRIMGTVTGQDGSPVYGAQLNVVGTRLGTLTNAAGQFIITSVPAGPQQRRVS